MLIPLHTTDSYVSDRTPRLNQIKGDFRNREILSRNVAFDSQPLDHIEPIAMSQQIASPDIAIPSVECGSGTVKSTDLIQNLANI